MHNACSSMQTVD